MVENPVPKVSVCMITYNHEPYIAQAIEGVLMQETDFLVELVIGEDCSTDNTRKICEDYAKRFPDKIRLLSRSKNLGMSANFLDTLENCNGEFIAFCEGDDYWVDERKLSVQVSTLIDNEDYSMCSHAVFVQNDDDLESIVPIASESRDSFGLDDVIQSNFEFTSCSYLFRRSVIMAIPKSIPALDWVLLLHSATYGRIKYLRNEMAVYRKHKGGWTGNFTIEKARFLHNVAKLCGEHFQLEQNVHFQRKTAFIESDVLFLLYQNGKFTEFCAGYSRFKSRILLLGLRRRFSLTVRRLFVPISRVIASVSSPSRDSTSSAS